MRFNKMLMHHHWIFSWSRLEVNSFELICRIFYQQALSPTLNMNKNFVKNFLFMPG